jgi:hypothetical protein
VTRGPDRATRVGLLVVAVSFVAYWLADRSFDAGRGDFFYLADAFLHGRTWLDFVPGPYDVIVDGARYFVPFAPFPAVALMPLVALIGPQSADAWEPGINAALAAASVGLCWWLVGRLGVRRLVDRGWLVLLFGFSTQILWVTTRGGVWHTGHLIATVLTLGCLIELWGRRRAVLIGLLAGAAFLTRAPVAFAIPFYALLLLPWLDATDGSRRTIPWRAWTGLALGVLPSIVGFFAYNAIRFGDPLESGYALATLPPFLDTLRQQGLFSLSHVGMNLQYFLLDLPKPILGFPFFHPDGLGMSVFVTTPGLLLAVRADWRSQRAWLLLGAAVAVLVPTLLYYGGGWLQFGYRYFLDSTPFVIAVCGLAAARVGRIGPGWRVLIAFGVLVELVGVYWAYNNL